MKTVRLTVAEALAQYLAAQMIEIDGKKNSYLVQHSPSLVTVT